MYLQWTSKWSRVQRGSHLPAVVLVLIVLACPVHATTVAMTTELGRTSSPPFTTLLTSEGTQGTTAPKQTTQATTRITSVPPTQLSTSQSNPTTTLPLKSTLATTPRLPTSIEATSLRPPSSAAATATSRLSTSITDARSLSTEHTTLSQRIPESTVLTTDIIKTSLYAKGGTTGITTDEDSPEVVTSDNVTTVITTMSPSMMTTLTIIQWFLLAVAVAASLFFVCICCHCCQVRRRRKAHSQSYHNRNTIEYATPTSPKEKWRNSWALEAMAYHIELPQETEEEMEAKHNPVFEEDETDTAAANRPAPHLTKL